MPYKSTLFLVALLAVPTVFAQRPQTDSKLIVATGQISRVDRLTRSYEMTAQADNSGPGGIFGGIISIGGSIGRPGGDAPSDPTRSPTASSAKTTFYITDRTVCKERTKVILCNELKVSDRVSVRGEEALDRTQRAMTAVEVERMR